MKRTEPINVLFTLLLGMLIPPVSKTATPAPATIKELRGGIAIVHLAESPHTVMAVLRSPEGSLLVDFENPDLEHPRATPEVRSRVFAALEKLDALAPRYLVLTHWHPDHVGGNQDLDPRTTIVAHRNVRRRLETRQAPHWLPQGVGPMLEAGLPDIVFDDDMTLHLGSLAVHLWHFGPAHTDGDIVVYFPHARVAHVGDLFHGFDNPAVGNDMVGLARTYEALLARLPADALLITGHGPVAGREELARAHDMLVDTLAWVRGRLAAGDGPQAIRAAAPPAPWNVRWRGSSRQLDMWISTIVSGLELELRAGEAEAVPSGDHTERLLAIHQEVLDAHLRSDADALLALHADEVVAADIRLGVTRHTRAEQAAMFRAYLGSTSFTVYEDQAPPVARVSEDGTLGWVIADVRAEGIQTLAGGASSRLAFRGVWIELYAWLEGSWHLIGTVSDIEPLEATPG